MYSAAMNGPGPVLMENYLRKYDAPKGGRPSTGASRGGRPSTGGRPVSRSGGRPSTSSMGGGLGQRPGTAGSIRSVGSRDSYGSNFSNASTAGMKHADE